MPATLCKFTFTEAVSQEFIEENIALSILSAEFLFGKAKVRIHGAYATADNPPRCIIDVTSYVGGYIAELFADRMMRLVGERGFDVCKVDRWKLKGEVEDEP